MQSNLSACFVRFLCPTVFFSYNKNENKTFDLENERQGERQFGLEFDRLALFKDMTECVTNFVQQVLNCSRKRVKFKMKAVGMGNLTELNRYYTRLRVDCARHICLSPAIFELKM